MKLDTNTGLTLSRILTLTASDRSFSNFNFSHCFVTISFTFYLLHIDSPYNLFTDPQSKLEIDFKLKNTNISSRRAKHKYHRNNAPHK